MLEISIHITAVMIGIAMALNVWRLVKGPGATDRILALDTLGINGIGIVMLMGISYGLADYFEAALLLATMGFVGTVALCKFLLSGDIIE
jgi:multicomponent K+:H+ antiporter subunit F